MEWTLSIIGPLEIRTQFPINNVLLPLSASEPIVDVGAWRIEFYRVFWEYLPPGLLLGLLVPSHLVRNSLLTSAGIQATSLVVFGASNFSSYLSLAAWMVLPVTVSTVLVLLGAISAAALRATEERTGGGFSKAYLGPLVQFLPFILLLSITGAVRPGNGFVTGSIVAFIATLIAITYQLHNLAVARVLLLPTETVQVLWTAILLANTGTGAVFGGLGQRLRLRWTARRTVAMNQATRPG